MTDSEKVLTYEEAKELCEKAFDGGYTYGSQSMLYGRNAAAYDWNHWLKENESLFKPKPTIEDVLRDMHAKLDEVTALYVGEAINSDERDSDEARIFAEYAAKLQLRGDAE